MPSKVYFATGTHHVLCKIPGLDENEFPYPQTFQDSWDTNHVRLPCSSVSAQHWAEIVQGLTTPITNSKELSKMMDLWGSDTGRYEKSRRTGALEAFLNQKADRPMPAAPNSSSLSSSAGLRLRNRQSGSYSPLRDLSFLELDSDQDEIASLASKDGDDEDAARLGPEGFSYAESDAAAAETDFLSREERDRFFKITLPKMQALALQLPELVMKPIPMLKQQEDSAVTLSQEQIACLLANAFFNTFPSRNPSSRPYSHYSASLAQKRRYSTTGGPSKEDSRKKNWQMGHGQEDSDSSKRKEGGGRTLNETPQDPHGSRPKAKPIGNPLKNPLGQMSLFAYFGKRDPPAPKPTSSSPIATAKLTTTSTTSAGMSKVHTSGADKTRVISTKDEKHQARKEEEQDEVKEPYPHYPSINFWTLFASDERECACTPTNAAKLRCILHYFDRVTMEMPQGTVTYHRQVLKYPVSLEKEGRISKDTFSQVQVRVDGDSPLEDDAPPGALQLDFANKNIGGGVLGHGAVQEEIRFLICPELIISRLFTQQLHENEAVLIKGAERYSHYNGYANTFSWHSDCVDTTPRDMLGRRKTEICAIDAIPFRSKEQRLRQFSKRNVLREINKAIVGFRRSPITASEWGLCRAEIPDPLFPAIATGNWGCGAFGGHLQLKFLIQLVAASVCGGYSRDEEDFPMGRDIVYYTYGLYLLSSEIETFMTHLLASPKAAEPSLILECILQYPTKSSRGEIVDLPQKTTLLEYVGKALGFPSADSFSSEESPSSDEATLSLTQPLDDYE